MAGEESTPAPPPATAAQGASTRPVPQPSSSTGPPASAASAVENGTSCSLTPVVVTS
jgi:hypothetical protein